jgi:hypothetical protein
VSAQASTTSTEPKIASVFKHLDHTSALVRWGDASRRTRTVISPRFFAGAAAVCALAVTPIAVASGGATATSTPKTAKVGKIVTLLVKGMKADEKVKAVELAPFGQKRTLYPRAGHGGSLIVSVKAQVKGKHTWTFTGRSSHRSAQTFYTVK